MASSGDRFYLSAYRLNPGREAVWADIGNLLKIGGLIFQGMGSSVVLFTPSAETPTESQFIAQWFFPTPEEWSEIIRRSDDPELFVGDGVQKVLHRKVRWEVSGAVQQKVWARDKFRCVYCGRQMGEVQLTVDHWLPLELGGVNDTTNYLSACRKCNKDKGCLHPVQWCSQKGLDFSELSCYLQRVSA